MEDHLQVVSESHHRWNTQKQNGTSSDLPMPQKAEHASPGLQSFPSPAIATDSENIVVEGDQETSYCCE